MSRFEGRNNVAHGEIGVPLVVADEGVAVLSVCRCEYFDIISRVPRKLRVFVHERDRSSVGPPAQARSRIYRSLTDRLRWAGVIKLMRARTSLVTFARKRVSSDRLEKKSVCEKFHKQLYIFFNAHIVCI